MRTFVKIFHSNNDPETLERKINEFTKNKEIIDIKYSISSYAMCNEYSSTEGTDYSVLLIYKIRGKKMVENLQNNFLETLHDLSLSIAYLRNSTLLPYETKLIASRCKISESEVFHVLETAKKEKWTLKNKNTGG